MYLKKIKAFLSDENNFKNDLIKTISQLQDLFMSLNDSAKISKTSSKLMLYNVEDLLDLG